MRLKTKDLVLVLKGKDKGTRGTILSVDRDAGRAVVEGVNMVKKHVRPNPQRGVKGGIQEREAALDASNLALICPGCSEPVRVGYHRKDDGSKVRSCKRKSCDWLEG